MPGGAGANHPYPGAKSPPDDTLPLCQVILEELPPPPEPKTHFNQGGPGKKMVLFVEKRGRNKAKTLTRRKKGKNAVQPAFMPLTEEMIMGMNHSRVKMELNIWNLPKHMRLQEMRKSLLSYWNAYEKCEQGRRVERNNDRGPDPSSGGMSV